MNNIYDLVAARVIEKRPEQAALLLSACAESLGPERDILLKQLMRLPLSPEAQAIVVEAVSRCQLSVQQRMQLLELLLREDIPQELLPALTDALIRGRPLKDQRAALLKNLLKQPVPSKVLPALAGVLTHTKLDMDQRAALLKSLLEQPVPSKALPALVEALTHTKLDVDQRAVLLEGLLGQPVPSEVLPALTDALIQGKPKKALREVLIQYLLTRPINQEQILSIFKSLVEQMNGKRLPEVNEMAKRLYEYHETLELLRVWIDPERRAWKEGQGQALYRVVAEGEPLETAFLDMLCEGNVCYLADACIEFIDRKQLWLMFRELLFEEEYYCEFDSDEPYILDCGVNIGLSIYYAKHRYPKARIVGFEPWSVAYECAVRNIERNHWKNVTVCHAALGPEEGVMNLVSMKENSLASTLTNRMDDYIASKHIEKMIEAVRVVPLSQYLTCPVDMLKMDIEGMEAQVLRECGDKLRQVQWFVCEYHFGLELADNSLAEILARLEKERFIFTVAKSNVRVARKRPFSYIGLQVSEMIWAKRDVIEETIESGHKHVQSFPR